MWFTRDWVTFDTFELETSVKGQNGVEFRQESSRHGPSYLTHVLHMSYTWFTRDWVTLDPLELETSVKSQLPSVKQTTIFTAKSYFPQKT